LNKTESPRFIPPNTNLLYQEATSSIFRAILDGKLKPGERLVEETIAQGLGVSRSPVRLAFQEMERKGIVVIIPRRGTYVAKWGITDIEDFAKVRVLLEEQAAEQAATRIHPDEIKILYSLVNSMISATTNQTVDREIEYDLAFHKQVVASSRNSTLISAYSTIELRAHLFMIYEKYIIPSISERIKLTKKHMPIVEALEAGDAITAKRLIIENVQEAVDALLERMRIAEKEGKDEGQFSLLRTQSDRGEIADIAEFRRHINF
jgi:DNA-binding GntR family transcriptional regulator